MTLEAVVPGPVAGPPPPPGKAAAGRGRSGGSRRRRLAFLAAGLVLLVGAVTGGLVVTGTSPAAAATENRHFVLVSTHGAPLWKARAWLFDGKVRQVYAWDTGGLKSGGRALWYFTDGGDGGTIEVVVRGKAFESDYDARMIGLRLDRDHCFLVDGRGHPRYTGDSVTGGCTPD